MKFVHAVLMAVAFLSLQTWTNAQTVFPVHLTGDQEVPGPGDPDGVGDGTVTLDPIGDTISWSIAYSNLTGLAMSGFHIHGPLPDLPAQQSAPVFVNLAQVGLGPIPDGTLTGTFTLAEDANLGSKIDQILADPSKFYTNIHTSIPTTGGEGYPAGAIRAALPEPASVALIVLGSLAMLHRRRRSD